MINRLIITALLATISLYAADIKGKVVGVADGDTITVLNTAKKQYKIRLLGIDAPESKQDFGTKSKQYLSSLVFGKEVTVKSTGTDRYKRHLGTVFIGNININLEMVKKGLAWHYKYYSDDKELANAELQARASKVGLWSHTSQIAPWDYRKGVRADSKAQTDNQKEESTGLYWITNSSSKRHNSKCRWFKNSKGRLGKKSEGIACKICGG